MLTRLKKAAFGGVAALALVFALPASPAFAINSVPCGDRADFLKIQTTTSSHCFANGGVTAVDIHNVLWFSSGNNRVTVNAEIGGLFFTDTLERWHQLVYSVSPPGTPVRVYEVRIW